MRLTVLYGLLWDVIIHQCPEHFYLRCVYLQFIYGQYACILHALEMGFLNVDRWRSNNGTILSYGSSEWWSETQGMFCYFGKHEIKWILKYMLGN